MLSIDRIGSSSAEVRYYSTLGRDAHAYYAEGQRKGRWWGSGARDVALVGDVDETRFRNILLGKSPDGESQWVRGPQDPTKQRRAGFDLTYSVPKSVSASWSQADEQGRQAIIDCCERALDTALEAMDDLCAVTRRGRNGHVQEKAKLVGAIFRHDTSRPIPGHVPDPNLHWHVVIANMAMREDGTIGAMDSRGFYRRGMKLALGTLFRTELSRELRELGLESYRPEKPNREGEKVSWFELSAVPKKLVEEMSKRRKQIERWLRKKGLSGARSSAKAALATRNKKQEFTQNELDNAWREDARKHGFSWSSLGRSKREPAPVDQAAEARKSLELAIARLSKERSRFSMLELLRFTAEEAQTRGVGIDAVRSAVDGALRHSQQLVRLLDVRGEPQWTTRELLGIEKRMLDTASRLNKSSRHTLGYGLVAEVLREFPTMRAEQTAGVRHMCIGQDIACVNGISGSGKTFMLNAARIAWERAGLKVLGTSLASKAAHGLEEASGIRSIHSHKLLYDIERGTEKLDARTVLVVDESGMLGTRMLERWTRLVEEAGAKLVLTGDHTQLQAIEAGAPFRVIAEREGVVELNEIIRQREAWQKKLVKDLRAGRSETALAELSERKLLYIGEDRDETMDRLVRDWKSVAIDRGKLSGTAIFAGTNLEVRTLNHLCQAARLQAGQLGWERLEVGDYEFRVGDRVIATRNNRPLLIRNGMSGTVTNIDGSSLRVRFQDGYQVEIDTNDYQHLALGYGMSTHKAQGATCQFGFLLMDQTMTDREQVYVGGSRAKGETRFYTDRLSGGDSTEELAKLMERSRRKDLAFEYLPEQELEVRSELVVWYPAPCWCLVSIVRCRDRVWPRAYLAMGQKQALHAGHPAGPKRNRRGETGRPEVGDPRRFTKGLPRSLSCWGQKWLRKNADAATVDGGCAHVYLTRLGSPRVHLRRQTRRGSVSAEDWRALSGLQFQSPGKAHIPAARRPLGYQARRDQYCPCPEPSVENDSLGERGIGQVFYGRSASPPPRACRILHASQWRPLGILRLGLRLT